MTREEAKELHEAFNHFANGGDLWFYNPDINRWYKQDNLYDKARPDICNVIEDKHFEARKAFALGEEIEYKREHFDRWHIIKDASWNDKIQYRPKLKEVYEWQWACRERGNYSLTDYYTEKQALDYCSGCMKFEPSKRIRK